MTTVRVICKLQRLLAEEMPVIMLAFVLNNRYDTAKADLLAKVVVVNAAKGPAKTL